VILILSWSAVVSSSTSRRTSQIFVGLVLFHALRLIFDTAALPKIRTAVVGLFDRVLNHEWTRMDLSGILCLGRLLLVVLLNRGMPGHFLPSAICYLLSAICYLLSAICYLRPSVVTFFRAGVCGPRFKVWLALLRRHHLRWMVRSVQFLGVFYEFLCRTLPCHLRSAIG
jgi:hypothetical protein